MPAIITNNLRIRTSDLFQRSLDENPSYAFFGKDSAWLDESNPDEINDTTIDRQSVYQDLLGIKKITSNDVMSVCPRINWVSGNIYDEYTDDVDLFNDKHPVTNNFYQFYVMTSDYNVYKCLYNNKRSKSLVKPSEKTPIPFSTPDGYIWKYMSTIASGDVYAFLTPNWMPVSTLYISNNTPQWVSQQSAVSGAIDTIKIVDGGFGYTNIPTVTVTGDGFGCTAIAIIDVINETITDIVVTNRGYGYKNAYVTIIGNGVGAVAKAIIPPKGGHGSDPKAELGATYKMIRVSLEGTENNKIPSDITYRKIGIFNNILSTELGSIVKCTDVNLFVENETLVGSLSNASGIISSIDRDKKWIYLKDVAGSFLVNETITSTLYGTTTMILDYLANKNLPLKLSAANTNDIILDSGDLLYVGHRTKVTRGDTQTEEIKFIISF